MAQKKYTTNTRKSYLDTNPPLASIFMSTARAKSSELARLGSEIGAPSRLGSARSSELRARLARLGSEQKSNLEPRLGSARREKIRLGIQWPSRASSELLARAGSSRRHKYFGHWWICVQLRFPCISCVFLAGKLSPTLL